MTSAGESRSLAEGVVRAARLAGHLAAHERHAVLGKWLAARLKGRSAEEVRSALEDLLVVFEPLPEHDWAPPALDFELEPEPGAESRPEPEPEPEKAATPEPAAPPVVAPVQEPAPLERLFSFARDYYGSRWEPSGDARADAERAQDALAEAAMRLRAVVPGEGGEERTLGAILDVLEARGKTTDAALRRAAEESFSRLLQAFSPSALEAQAGSKGVRLGVFYKANLYEAWCEKYEQLQGYHKSGRLVGDLRTAFRTILKDSEREERSR